MYDTKKVTFFCSKKDPVPVNLHVIHQFECPGCKAKYIGKTDRSLEFRSNEHSDFRTSAVGKHLYECEHFGKEDFHPRVTVDQAEGLCQRITLHFGRLNIETGALYYCI